MKLRLRYFPFIFILFVSCSNNNKFEDNFNSKNDRVWIGKNYWAVPLEDWHLRNGRLECIGNRSNARLNILTRFIEENGKLNISVRTGILKTGTDKGTVGIRIAIQDKTDNDYRSLCYFGTGIDAGVDTRGNLFIGKEKSDLPADFNFSDFYINLNSKQSDSGYRLNLLVSDNSGKSATLISKNYNSLRGMIALVNNFDLRTRAYKGPNFWFDELLIQGSILSSKSENSFGPVLWAMYTLSRNVLKISAQMVPLGSDDEQNVELQVYRNNQWVKAGTSEIDKNSRIASFKIIGWNDTTDIPYRIIYNERDRNGNIDQDIYKGLIKKEPKTGKLVMGGLTCQYHYGFPYKPLVKELTEMKPDILYFSGDQIYEQNGGYDIIRFPAERSILNYLGKWYMFGWAFGDLIKNCPTICLHDDHEVYQGNLWGDGGKIININDWENSRDSNSGFVQPIEMLNVVIHTNSSHLPDPVDPKPLENNLNVYFTDMVYGGVSFAIVGDRIFKSGPEHVSFWEGRNDHLKMPLSNPEILNKPGLNLLGERQMNFLNKWIKDWENVYLKVILSQTTFTNVATHHGQDKMLLAGDLDSGGWPKNARDEAIELIRKCFAFHICGDQHIPELIHYGVDEFQDGGWCFCTPAITVGYQRRFLPDQLGWPVINRPEHNLPNTGYYTDAFGNKNYVYAIGNPDDITNDENRYRQAKKTASGFGIIRFDTDERTITSEAYIFPADSLDFVQKKQFPGWPYIIHQQENYGRKPKAWLPTLKFSGVLNPVVNVISPKDNELIYTLRIKGNSFQPWVFMEGKYNIQVGDPEKDIWMNYELLQANKINNEIKEIRF